MATGPSAGEGKAERKSLRHTDKNGLLTVTPNRHRLPPNRRQLTLHLPLVTRQRGAVHIRILTDGPGLR